MVAHAAHGAASSEVTPIATQRVASAAVVIGESLGTALRTLQRPGLAIIYSSALVPPNLKVTVLPSAPEAADQAREILAPHSLSLHPVAPGLYAVVRANLPQPSPDIAPTLSRVERPLPRDSDPPPISDVVVQGTREAGEGPDVATAQLLDRAQISAQPGLRDDAFRSAARVPGVTLNGLSAAPHVRGVRNHAQNDGS
jgi:hypothetical protein